MRQEALAEESRAAFVRESAERRRLHNMVQELRGNIRVYVRVKPLTKHERQAGDTSVLRCEGGHRVQCSAGGSLKVRLASCADYHEFVHSASLQSAR